MSDTNKFGVTRGWKVMNDVGEGSPCYAVKPLTAVQIVFPLKPENGYEEWEWIEVETFVNVDLETYKAVAVSGSIHLFIARRKVKK